MGRIRKPRKTNPRILIKYEGRGSSEEIYFSNFKRRNLIIKFSTGDSTDVEGMLKDLIIYMNKEDFSTDYGDKIYLIIDTDLKEKRINEIKA